MTENWVGFYSGANLKKKDVGFHAKKLAPVLSLTINIEYISKNRCLKKNRGQKKHKFYHKLVSKLQ
jgi:hypothetical protein